MIIQQDVTPLLERALDDSQLCRDMPVVDGVFASLLMSQVIPQALPEVAPEEIPQAAWTPTAQPLTAYDGFLPENEATRTPTARTPLESNIELPTTEEMVQDVVLELTPNMGLETQGDAGSQILTPTSAPVPPVLQDDMGIETQKIKQAEQKVVALPAEPMPEAPDAVLEAEDTQQEATPPAAASTDVLEVQAHETQFAVPMAQPHPEVIKPQSFEGKKPEKAPPVASFAAPTLQHAVPAKASVAAIEVPQDQAPISDNKAPLPDATQESSEPHAFNHLMPQGDAAPSPTSVVASDAKETKTSAAYEIQYDVAPSGQIMTQKANMRIHQEGLGTINVSIDMKDAASVTLVADSNEAKHIMQAHIPHLKTNFSDANVPLDKVHIEYESAQDQASHQHSKQSPFAHVALETEEPKEVVSKRTTHRLIDAYV